jgi:hypothetical protein
VRFKREAEQRQAARDERADAELYADIEHRIERYLRYR